MNDDRYIARLKFQEFIAKFKCSNEEWIKNINIDKIPLDDLGPFLVKQFALHHKNDWDQIEKWLEELIGKIKSHDELIKVKDDLRTLPWWSISKWSSLETSIQKIP